MRRILFFLSAFFILVLLMTSCSLPKTKDQPAPSGSASVTPTATVETSESNLLIDAALQNGEIDAQTALVYKLYAQFNDTRLPSDYQGEVNINTDSHIIDQIQADFSSLSPEQQAIVLPYLVPPSYQGAWGPPAEGSGSAVEMIDLPCDKIQTDKWDHTSAMHSPVRFWWLKSRPGDGTIANRFLTAMDDDIWPKLTGLMGRVPLPDGNTQCNGDTPDFDIYITPQIARSYAAAYFPPGCRETPSYIVLNPAVSDAILAHEFMHAIQWSYNTSADCMYPGEYAWLAEATASWAQNFVYPASNEEHGYVPWFYNGGTAGDPPVLNMKNDAHEYGTHLFFFYVTNHFGQPDIVKKTWDNTTSMKSVEAVDNAIPGGIDAVWSDFAVANMVEPPQDDYQLWDQLNNKPEGSSLTDTETTTNTSYYVGGRINHLSIRYDRFTFSDDSRLVTYFNGLTWKLNDEPVNTYMGTIPIKDNTMIYKSENLSPDAYEGVKIQAYFKIQGEVEWQLEDWTDRPYVSFCRDAQSERLSELIIITSNSSQDNDLTPAGSYKPILQVSDVGCWRYGGSASMLFSGSGEGGTVTDEQIIPNVAFERTETHPDIPYPFLHFKVVEGQLDRTYDYLSSDGSCKADGENHENLAGASPFVFGNDLYILYGAISGPSLRRYGGQAATNQPITVNAQCPDGSGSAPALPLPWFYADVLSQILEKVYSVPVGGKLEGSDNLLQELSNAEMKFEWTFEPLFESGSSGNNQPDSSGTQVPPINSSGTPQTPQDAGLTDVPDYPNIESSSYQQASGFLIMITSDSQEDAANYYREELPKLGWQDISNPNDPGSEVIMLSFAQERKMLTIMIGLLDGKTQIMIKQLSF